MIPSSGVDATKQGCTCLDPAFRSIKCPHCGDGLSLRNYLGQVISRLAGSSVVEVLGSREEPEPMCEAKGSGSPQVIGQSVNWLGSKSSTTTHSG